MTVQHDVQSNAVLPGQAVAKGTLETEPTASLKEGMPRVLAKFMHTASVKRTRMQVNDCPGTQHLLPCLYTACLCTSVAITIVWKVMFAWRLQVLR